MIATVVKEDVIEPVTDDNWCEYDFTFELENGARFIKRDLLYKYDLGKMYDVNFDIGDVVND